MRQRGVLGAAAQGQPGRADQAEPELAADLEPVHRPVWFAGIAAICIGFLQKATARGFGELATVEPVLILELPLTLIIASRMFGHHMQSREWLSSAAMTIGLGGLLFLLSPTAGRNGHVHWYGWFLGIGLNLVLVAGPGRVRAARFGEVVAAAIVGGAGLALARSPLLAAAAEET